MKTNNLLIHTMRIQNRSLIPLCQCHQTDDIAPFPLTTYEEIEPLLSVIRTSIETFYATLETSYECNDYKEVRFNCR